MASESEKRETLADIVAQMRGRGEDGRMDRRLWLDYADRIEAAAKRVVVSKTETTTVGNAAAMRETLGEIVELAKEWWNHDYDPAITLGLIIDRAGDALSAPARQCDVSTAEEQFDRFAKHCIGKDCDSCEHGNRGRSHAHCALVWAQTPYDAEKGGKA